MNGFLRRWVAFPFQGERNAVLVEMGIETRRVLKGPDVKLIRIFDRHFGFVWNGFIHSWSRSEKPIQYGRDRTYLIKREVGIAASIVIAASPLFFDQWRLALPDGDLLLRLDGLCSFRNNDAEHAFVEVCLDLRFIGAIRQSE
jgi:hypothetical protein